MLHFKKVSLIAAILLFSIPFTANAGHGEQGTHIGYKAIDSTTYEVILTLYRDCNGIVLGDVKIGVTGKSSGYFESVMTKVSTTDITGAYLKCNFISRCTGSYAYGFEKTVYKDTIDISGGACEYRFSYSDCCRNSNITTGAGDKFYYNYALVNKCFGMNNSVQADLEPRLLIPVGKDVFMTSFSGDKIDTKDSVSYKMVDPYQDSVTSIPYSGSWSTQRPISFLGYPNAGLNFPAGFRFDETTSDLRFRPTVQNQVTVFCHEAKEYREVNGKMEMVGLTRMDYEVVVVPSPNTKTPIIKGAQSVDACVGEKKCISFETDDNDKNDSTFLDFVGLPQGATVTYGRKGRLATAEVCFTPTSNQVSNTPYYFTAIVADNSCDIGGRSTITYSFKVNENPSKVNVSVTSKTTSCSAADIVVQLTNTTGLTGVSVKMYDEDRVSSVTGNSGRLYFKGSGWKKFFVELSATNTPCVSSIVDSVFITPQYGLNLTTTNDSSICTPSSINFATSSSNGTSPFIYNWRKENLSFTSNNNQFTQFVDSMGLNKYFLLVADSNGCIGYDSTTITLNNALIIDAGTYPSLCGASGGLQLKGKVTMGASPYNFTWLPNNATTDTVTVNPSTTTSYILQVEDNVGCFANDTTTIVVAPAVSFTPPSTTQVCEGSSLTLQATAIVGVFPIRFTWDGKPSGGFNYTFSPKQSGAVVIEMTDSNNCKTTRFTQVVVNPAPQVTIAGNRNVCRGIPTFIQAIPSNGTPPYSYLWSNNTGLDSFTTVINTPRSFIVEVTDDKGCKANANATFTPFPKDNVTLPQLQPICEIDNPFTLNDPRGGVWSGTGVDNTGKLFIPQLAGIGIHELTYNYNSTNNCPEKEVRYAIIKQVPDVDFTVDKVKGIPNDQFNFGNQTIADTSYTVVWNFGDFGAPGNISQLANPSYTYTKSGLYTVKLTVYNGVCGPQTETKADYILVDSSTISVRTINETAIKLYPNPAKDKLIIEAGNEIVSIKLIDVLGREHKVESLSRGTKQELDLSSFATGIYTIEVRDAEGSIYFSKIKISR